MSGPRAAGCGSRAPPRGSWRGRRAREAPDTRIRNGRPPRRRVRSPIPGRDLDLVRPFSPRSAPAPVPAPAPTRTAAAPSPPPPLDLDAGSAACRLRPRLHRFPPHRPGRPSDHDPGAVPSELVFKRFSIPQIVTVSTGEPESSIVGVCHVLPRQEHLPSCAGPRRGPSSVRTPAAPISPLARRDELDRRLARATDIAAAAVGAPRRARLSRRADRRRGAPSRSARLSSTTAPPRASPRTAAEPRSSTCAPRNSLLAMTIDARVAMTPRTRARSRIRKPKPTLGTDAVVFVGGLARAQCTRARCRERWQRVQLHRRGRPAPPRSDGDDPRSTSLAEDEPVVWSCSPNGLDLAAHCRETHGGANMFVARRRPRTASPNPTRVLESGRCRAKGASRPPLHHPTKRRSSKTSKWSWTARAFRGLLPRSRGAY